MSHDPLKNLNARLAREQRARLEAERLLEEKSDELYESLMQVKANESLLSNSLSSMREGFLLTNKYAEIILANEQFKTLYPELIQHNELIAGKALSFELLTQNTIYTAVAEGKQSSGYFELSTTAEKVVAVNASTTPEGFIATTHRDITSIKQVEKEQQQLLLELFRAQRMEAIGKMSGMIAHDFNNIIASIQGYVGFLKEDSPPVEKLHDSIDRIQMAADKAEQLIQNITVYGREQNIDYQDIEVTELLKHSCDLIKSTLGKTIHQHFKCEYAPAIVVGNSVQLDRAFMNLLTNARNAINENTGGEINIVIDRLNRFNPENSDNALLNSFNSHYHTVSKGVGTFNSPCLRISFLDNGSGMKPEVMEHIFELYFTADNRQSGSGIGMFNTASIVVDHGGLLNVYSNHGHGTLIEVILPLVSHNIIPTQTHDTLKKQIMVIDDDISVGEMLTQTLQRNNLQAMYFQDAQNALDTFMENPDCWQLIISDQIMPSLKGTDILAYLRDSGHSTPFILCSGQLDSIRSMQHLKHANTLLKKPVSKTTLLTEVQRCLMVPACAGNETSITSL